MAVITWIFRIIILAALILLAVQNQVPTRFSIFNDISIELPLIVLLFAFFALGALMGILILLPKYLSLKWSARKLRKENEVQKSQLDKEFVPQATESRIDVPMAM